MPKVRHVSDFMVDVCQDRENCIGRLCRYLESELNGINARVVGSPIIMTDGNSDEMLHVTIPYLPCKLISAKDSLFVSQERVELCCVPETWHVRFLVEVIAKSRS